MDKAQLKDSIVRTLKEVELYSPDAVNLLMGTAAQESGLGKYTRQLGNGPALGIFQMEPNTFKDIIKNYLVYNRSLLRIIKIVIGKENLDAEDLELDLKLAIIMCRVHYLRVPQALPSNVQEYAQYWKKYYNTMLGKGTVEEFINNYKKYVG